MQKIVLCTGGTGGHIFPALAVAEEIRLRYPESRLLFIGGDRGPEKRLAEQSGLEFVGLPVRGVLGKGLRSLSSACWLALGLAKCFGIYRSFQPDIVLGFGGYAGFVPVLLACWKGIATAVHEQNSYPGMTNRILGKKVDRVFLSFPDENLCFSPGKTLVTGNPVRESIRRLDHRSRPQSSGAKGRILIFGGSQGAKAINEAVLQALPWFHSHGLELMHQTGWMDYEQVRRGYLSEGMDNSSVYPFIQDMAAAYSWSDLVICRAGASTLAELTVAGKPSILIPYPHAIHRHQLINAGTLEKAGGAVVIRQEHLKEGKLAQVATELFSQPEKLSRMSKAARKIGNPQAASTIVDCLVSLANNNAVLKTTNFVDSCEQKFRSMPMQNRHKNGL